MRKDSQAGKQGGGTLDLTCEERRSDSPLIEQVWRDDSGWGGSLISLASSYSEIVVTRYQGKLSINVRGPETRATTATGPEGAEYIGIVLKLGVFMPLLPPSVIMNRNDPLLPTASNRTFWLDSSAWEFPTFENADTFVQRLIRAGLLVHDPIVDAILQRRPVDMSLRTLQRRFVQATGLTHSTLQQIERARHAVRLLKQGYSILDTVDEAGYFDQPHLTRSLRHFVGLTPAQITDANRAMPMSFLCNTRSLEVDYDRTIERSTRKEELA